MENWEIVQGFPEYLRRQTRRFKRMSEAEGGGKVTSQYSDCRSTQSTSV